MLFIDSKCTLKRRECLLKSLLNSLFIIFIGLSIGYLLQRIVKSEKNHFSIPLATTRRILQKTAILFLMPLNYIGAYWAMDFTQINLLFFPVVCLFQLILGGTIALLIARSIHMNDFDTGAFFCCGFFSNLGNIGVLICFLLLGEEGYKLAALYILSIQIAYYTIGFPVAKYYAMKKNQQGQKIIDLKAMIKDPFIMVGMASIIIGLVFNASGWERPIIFSSIIALFIPISTILLLISIGLSMKLKKVREYLKESILITCIKFMIIPTVMVSIGFLMGYHQIIDGLPLKVILILSSMPVAFNSLIPPSIYGLNLDLANSCWIVTTFGLGLFLPILFLLVNLI